MKLKKLMKRLKQRQRGFDELKPSMQHGGKIVSSAGHEMHRPGSQCNRP